MYRAIIGFTDSKVQRIHYDVGDTYPKDGVKVSKSRIQELLTNNNKRGFPVIEEVQEDMAMTELSKKLAKQKGVKNEQDIQKVAPKIADTVPEAQEDDVLMPFEDYSPQEPEQKKRGRKPGPRKRAADDDNDSLSDN